MEYRMSQENSTVLESYENTSLKWGGKGDASLSDFGSE